MNEIILNSGYGIFVYAYNEYAYLLSYLFEYKVLDGCKCGFPSSALDKVLSELDQKQINYKLVGKNMDVLKHMEYEENNFLKIMKDSNIYFEKLKVIESINKLLWHMDVKKLVALNSKLM